MYDRYLERVKSKDSTVKPSKKVKKKVAEQEEMKRAEEEEEEAAVQAHKKQVKSVNYHYNMHSYAHTPYTCP